MRDVVGERIADLIKNVDYFAKQGIKNFSGPSTHFYSKVIGCHNGKSLRQVLDDPDFYEYAYATLASWGMHRLGERGAKMQDFDSFKESIHSCRSELLNLDGLALERLQPDQMNQTQKVLQTIFHKLKIMKTDSKIVGTSKTLHFILPELVVPIDREYTLPFFKKHLTPKNEETVFAELFKMFVEISQRLKLGKSHFETEQFQPSVAKLIDNAIVGYNAKRRR